MTQQRWNDIMGPIRRLAGASADAAGDRHLLEQFAAQRDEQAFSSLVQRHGPMVLATCRRVLHDAADAEEAFQATFCVLARKASATGWGDSIGAWLHAVACRIALKARAVAVRRRQYEQEAIAMRSQRAATAELDSELRLVLDAELERLPAKYRVPLVLCYLEGQTNEEAARQLGWPKGTVQSRLARGRDLLRRRLERGGLALSAAALATLSSEVLGMTAVSEPMLQATLPIAVRFRFGSKASELPGLVEALAKGAIQTMWVTRAKFVAVVFLAVGLLGGVGIFHWQRPGPMGAPQARAVPLPEEEKPANRPHAVRELPGGLIDVDNQEIYVVNTDGGIDALNLKRGKLLWKTEKGKVYWPLAVVGRQLIVRAREENEDKGARDIVVRVVVLNLAETGKPLSKSGPLIFPKWIGSHFRQGFPFPWLDSYPTGGAGGFERDNRIVASFVSTARIDKEELIIDWHSPNSTHPEEKTKATTGAFRVNLQSGAVKASAVAETPREAPAGNEQSVEGKVVLGECEYVVEAKDVMKEGVDEHLRFLKAKEKKTGTVLWEHPLKGYGVAMTP